MKTIITMLLMLAMVVVSGCQSSSERGGSVLKDKGFKITVPTFNTDIKQGEFQAITISLTRDEYFRQDVQLLIEVPKGLSVEPNEILIKASDRPDVQLQVSASKEAALSEYQISVKGTPKTGEPTSTKFSVKVVAP